VKSKEKYPILTCTICPNGCGINIESLADGSYSLQGNRCPRGVLFARFQLSLDKDTVIHLQNPEEEIPEKELASILKQWKIDSFEQIKNSPIQGSPERSEYRCLIKSKNHLFILERFHHRQKSRKELLARRMFRLNEMVFPVPSPIKQSEEGFLYSASSGIWQLSPYIRGIPLDRQQYWKDEKKGAALGRLLGKLSSWQAEDDSDRFDLIEFINHLQEKLKIENSKLFQESERVFSFTEKEIFPWLKNWPLAFNHGDPHPLNVIWGKQGIEALVDWEFSGQKPLLYDPALAMGCVGSESPHAFTGPFNLALFKSYKTYSKLDAKTLSHLPSMVLILRFAWLNEWVRHQDREMQKQELLYMNHLMERIL